LSVSSIIGEVLNKTNWLDEATKATDSTSSLLPLLVKTAIDGYNAAKGGGSLLTVIADLEKDVAAYEAARSSNHAPAPTSPVAPSVEP